VYRACGKKRKKKGIQGHACEKRGQENLRHWSLRKRVWGDYVPRRAGEGIRKKRKKFEDRILDCLKQKGKGGEPSM